MNGETSHGNLALARPHRQHRLVEGKDRMDLTRLASLRVVQSAFDAKGVANRTRIISQP